MTLPGDLRRALAEELREAVPYARPYGVLWQYGNGLPYDAKTNPHGLRGPFTAEEMANGNILICERDNCRVIEVDKRTKKIVWQYGVTGAPGVADGYLYAPHRACELPTGEIIVADFGDIGAGIPGRVLVIDKATKSVVWKYESPSDSCNGAIYWDDDRFLVGAWGSHRVFLIRRSTKAIEWEMPVQGPEQIQKLTRWGGFGIVATNTGNSFGGDFLVCELLTHTVKEIRMSDKSVVWSYGDGTHWDYGEVWNKLRSPAGVCRLGICDPNRWWPLTVIGDTENSRIFAVTYDKRRVWQLGGVMGRAYHAASIPFGHPCSIRPTRDGNLLIADWARNVVMEVAVPFQRVLPPTLDTYVFKDYSTTDNFADSLIAEVHGYQRKMVLIANKGANSLDYEVYGGWDPSDISYLLDSGSVAGGARKAPVITYMPFAFMKVRVKSTTAGAPTTCDVSIHCAGVE